MAASTEPLTANASVDPGGAGVDRMAIDRLVGKFQALIAAGRVPGAVLLIVRHGKVACFEALGRQGPEAASPPMHPDAIFRIYSMTKPIVSVAVMQLVEAGALRLGEPVSKFLPEFLAPAVALERDGRLDSVPALQPMTVQDLLRHTAGLTYEILPGATAVRQAYADAKLGSPHRSNADFSRLLASLPLAHQPGSCWEYSRATDVLGRLVEVVSGQPLGERLRSAIFQPLAMADTGFSVPSREQQRIAEPFAADPDTGAAVRLGEPRRVNAFESGGGGLVSTALDYGRFLQMLLQGGRLGDARVLGRKTVELMTADHLGPLPRCGDLLPPGYGFGLGLAVRIAAGLATDPGSIGTYGWSGASGTAFFVDPAEAMFGVMLAQAPGQAAELRELFRNLACAAVD